MFRSLLGMVGKLDIFLGSPLKGPVNLIPGIGKISQKNLKDSKIEQVFHLILIFLILEKDKEIFLSWLKKYQPNSRYRLLCFNALSLWCDKYF